jgi:hypothetical protein
MKRKGDATAYGLSVILGIGSLGATVILIKDFLQVKFCLI